MKTESDFSNYSELPFKFKYSGKNVKLVVGFENDEEVNVVLTVEQSLELFKVMEKTIKEIIHIEKIHKETLENFTDPKFLSEQLYEPAKFSMALNKPKVGKKCEKVTGFEYDYCFCKSGSHAATCFNTEEGICHQVIFTQNWYSEIECYTEEQIKNKEFISEI